MRRPILPLSAGMILGIITIDKSGLGAAWSAAIFAVAAIILLFSLRAEGGEILFDYRRLVFLFFALGMLIMSIETAAELPAEDEYASVKGMVLSVTEKAKDEYRIEVDAGEKGRILISWYDALPGISGGEDSGAGEASGVSGETDSSNDSGSEHDAEPAVLSVAADEEIAADVETAADEEIAADVETAADEEIVGREITAQGSLSRPKERTNPGCFDYRRYLRSKKITSVMTASEIEFGFVTNPVSFRLACLRTDFENEIAASMGDEAASVVRGMLFGDRSTMDEDLYEEFQKNGTAHILAVSGLHIGIIYAFINVLIGARRRLGFNIVIAIMLFSYAFLAGFSSSVMRAVIMICLHIAANIFHYRYDLVTAACTAAIIMLLLNPYALFNVGFQMSFLAILSLGFLMKPIADKVRSKAVRDILLPVIVIQIGMAPYTLFVFNYFSLSAFVANIPVVFLSGIIIPIGIILFVLSFVFPQAMPVGAGVMETATNFLIKCNQVTFLGGRLSFEMASPPLVVIAVYYAALFFCVSEYARIIRGRKMKWKWMANLAVVIALAFAFSFVYDTSERNADCVFVDVGQGACCHLRTPSGKSILIDAGGSRNYEVGSKTVGPYLLKNGVKDIDIAIVSHRDSDHYKGIKELAKAGRIKKIAFNEVLRDKAGKLEKDTGMQREVFIWLAEGDALEEEGFRAEVMAAGTSGDENADSLVIKASYGDFDILLTGDIPEESEKMIADEEGSDLDSEILSVPHHGSRYSSSAELVESVTPAIAVIQVGKNNYGHPADGVIKRYEESGSKVLRNDELGAICIRTNGRGYDVKCIKGEL